MAATAFPEHQRVRLDEFTRTEVVHYRVTGDVVGSLRRGYPVTASADHQPEFAFIVEACEVACHFTVGRRDTAVQLGEHRWRRPELTADFTRMVTIVETDAEEHRRLRDRCQQPHRIERLARPVVTEVMLEQRHQRLLPAEIDDNVTFDAHGANAILEAVSTKPHLSRLAWPQVRQST